MSAGDPGLERHRAAARGVIRLTRILGCLLLVVACLPGHAQNAAAEPAAAPVAQADAGAADTGAIALVDIAERADADEGFAQAIRRQAQSIDVVADLQPRLDEIRASVHMKQASLRSMDLRAIPIARLESLSRYWGFDARRFRHWKADYKAASEPLTIGADQVTRRIAAWEATRAALPAGSLPAALSSRIDVVTRELNDARQALSAPLAAQIALGRSANRLEADIASGQAVVGRAITYIDKRLLRMDAPPLWRAGGAATSDSSVALERAMDMETRFLRQYAAANFPNQRVLQVIQVLLLPLLLWLAWRVRARPGAVDADRTRPLRRPFASWILLAMIGALVFEPDAPMLQVQIAIAMTLVPVLRLLPGDMRRRLGWWPYLSIALYLLLRLATLPLATTNLYRWSLLALALLGVASTLGLSWQLRRRTRETGAVMLEQLVLGAGWAVVALLAVSIVANAFGNVSLAEMLLTGVVESGYMALLVYAAYTVFSALLGEVFASRFAAPLGRAQVGGTSLLALLLRLLAIAALLGWLVFAMQEFRVFRPVFEALRAVFTYRVSYGQLSLSLGDVAVFVVAVFLAFWIASLVKVLLHEEVLPRLALADGVDHSIAALTYYGVLILGLLGALSAAGFKLSQLSLLLGALGVGIGLGLQDVVKNFVSGLILMFERPLKPGDVVDIAGTTGRVHEIGMRATTLRTFDGADVVVPNGALLTDKFTNWTLRDRGKRMDVDVGIAYGTDAALAIRVLEQATCATPKVAVEPAPAVLFLGLGESALNFSVRAWTNEFDDSAIVRSDLVTRLYMALAAAGIEIPFPQRNITLRAVAPEALGLLSPRGGARLDDEAPTEAGG
jgi:small-conductance mechanosensitive channel